MVKIHQKIVAQHTINQYHRIYDRLKQINSNIEFSSDFIIGYPGEEEVDFQATYELIKKIKFINKSSRFNNNRRV